MSNTLYSVVLAGFVFLVITAIRRKRCISAVSFVILAVLWSGFTAPALKLLAHLGSDSFAEAANFDLNEAVFYVQTFAQEIFLILDRRYLYRTLLVVLLSTVFYLGLYRLLIKLELSSRKQALVEYGAGFLLTVPLLFFVVYKCVGFYLLNSSTFEEISHNFSSTGVEASRNTDKPLTLMVYIGESTSAMNMGIYGYFRESTPRLKEWQSDPGFIIFKNVFSTHTHTSESLLENLSISQQDNKNYRPIYERKRTSVVDVLNSAGIKSYLISNQGKSGTWNMASTVIFKNAVRVFSEKGNNSGNLSKSKTFDHVLLQSKVPDVIDKINSDAGGVIFFHSYAGHGPYLRNVPPDFRAPIDQKLKDLEAVAVTGLSRPIKNIEAYDSTLRYVDYSLSIALDMVKSRKEPFVFLYFSDHGESVYANRAHDSSRFIFEMAHIPFFMYFNEAAQEEFPDIYAKYKTSAEKNEIATLAQLPSTLFDLLDVKLKSPSKNSDVFIGGKQKVVSPILVRRTEEGITFVNLNPASSIVSLLDRTEDTTRTFAIMKSRKQNEPRLCYRSSNTLAKVVRGTNVASCVETDVLIEKTGEPFLSSPKLTQSGSVSLSKIIEVVNRKKTTLWINAVNLDQPESCNAMARFLAGYKLDLTGSVVGFPATTPFTKQMLSCSKRIQALGLRTSYQVPSHSVRECLGPQHGADRHKSPGKCPELKQVLQEAKESEIFTDFLFDVEDVELVPHLTAYTASRLNIRSVPLESLDRFRAMKNVGFVIPASDDPN